MTETMRRVAVGSANPVKLGAVRAVLAWAAPSATVEPVTVPSGVPDQPFGDDETILGGGLDPGIPGADQCSNQREGAERDSHA